MRDNIPNFRSTGDLPTAGFDALEDSAPDVAAEQKLVALTPGDMVGERFQVVAQLGFGGMGAVYQVNDIRMEEERALKVMLPSLLKSEKAHTRFLEEIKISQKLSNDRIVRVHDLVDDAQRGIQFFTMELVKGTTLGRRMHDVGGYFQPSDALDIMLQLCDALSYAHQYTIHRDLKPQNIMVQPDGQVKILDFGLAKLMTPGRLNESSMALGTAYYQAPEQSVHLSELDQRADIYSLGVILYQMLTGEIPVGRFKEPRELDSAIPKNISDANMLCLETRPDDRYGDVSDFANALRKTSSRKEKKVSKKRVNANVNSARSSNPIFVTILAVLTVILVAGGAYWFMNRPAPTPNTIGELTPETEISADDQVRAAMAARDTADAAMKNARETIVLVDDFQSFALGQAAYERGELSEENEDYKGAQTEYDSATEKYNSSLKDFEAHQTIVNAEQKLAGQVIAAKLTATNAMKAAQDKGAAKGLKGDWDVATNTYGLADKHAARNENSKALKYYDETSEAFKSIGNRMAAINTEQNAVDTALKDIKNTKSLADKDNAALHAKDLYRKGEASQAKGDGANTRPEKTKAYTEGATFFTQAGAEAKTVQTKLANDKAMQDKNEQQNADLKAEQQALGDAKIAMQKAKNSANSLNAAALAKTKYEKAASEEARAVATSERKRQTTQYKTATSLYDAAAREAQQMSVLANQKDAAISAKRIAESAKGNAQSSDITTYASTARDSGDSSFNEANSLYSNALYKEAQVQFKSATTKYNDAIALSASMKQVAKDDANDAREKALELRKHIETSETTLAQATLANAEGFWKRAEAARQEQKYETASNQYNQATTYYASAINTAASTPTEPVKTEEKSKNREILRPGARGGR